MSVGSLGILGSLAGSPLVQKGSEIDKTQRDAADAARQAEAEARAESAAGIGQTEEESQASDRDADGRRMWERPPATRKDGEDTEPQAAAAPLGQQAKDPTGQSGTKLDISG